MRPPRIGIKPVGPVLVPRPPTTPPPARAFTMRLPARYRAQRVYLLNTSLTMELVNMIDLLIRLVRAAGTNPTSLYLVIIVQVI